MTYSQDTVVKENLYYDSSIDQDPEIIMSYWTRSTILTWFGSIGSIKAFLFFMRRGILSSYQNHYYSSALIRELYTKSSDENERSKNGQKVHHYVTWNELFLAKIVRWLNFCRCRCCGLSALNQRLSAEVSMLKQA